VALMCEVLQVSRSGFYRWLSRPPSKRTLDNAELVAFLLAKAREQRQIPGYRKLWRMAVDAGFRCSQNRVQRLLQQAGYCSIRHPRPGHRKPRPTMPARPNLLNRQFHAERPDQVWVSDITQLRCQDGWLYLAMVMDLHSRRIVGWAHGRQNDSQLVLQALEQAWSNRQPDNPGLFHSDQGSQYCSAAVMHWLTRKGFTLSMSRRGNCWDNACAESFFAQMKTEWIRPLGEPSRTEMQAEVDDYIDGFYNAVRIHGTLNGVPPLQFEAAA
jgi:putative transposase